MYQFIDSVYDVDSDDNEGKSYSLLTLQCISPAREHNEL